MTDEKWQETIGKIKDEFEVFENGTRKLEESPGEMEYIIFQSPLGKVKLERSSRPLVLNKKAIGSKRIGGRTYVKYIYSDTEKIHTLKAYRFDEKHSEWIEMDSKAFT